MRRDPSYRLISGKSRAPAASCCAPAAVAKTTVAASATAAARRLRFLANIFPPYSEPGRLIDLITQQLAGGEGAAIVRHDFEPTLVEVWAVSSHVRCQQHVRQSPQRVLARQRL